MGVVAGAERHFGGGGIEHAGTDILWVLLSGGEQNTIKYFVHSLVSRMVSLF